MKKKVTIQQALELTDKQMEELEKCVGDVQTTIVASISKLNKQGIPTGTIGGLWCYIRLLSEKTTIFLHCEILDGELNKFKKLTEVEYFKQIADNTLDYELSTMLN